MRFARHNYLWDGSVTGGGQPPLGDELSCGIISNAFFYLHQTPLKPTNNFSFEHIPSRPLENRKLANSVTGGGTLRGGDEIFSTGPVHYVGFPTYFILLTHRLPFLIIHLNYIWVPVRFLHNTLKWALRGGDEQFRVTCGADTSSIFGIESNKKI